MFDDEYFIITAPREDDRQYDLLPYLGPDPDTARLPFRYDVIPPGSNPLIFRNSAKAMRDRRGETTIRTPPDILFDGDNPIVQGGIRQQLLVFNIPNLVLQPAVYADEWGVRHEDYWYLTFLDTFHCWSKKKSDLGGRVKAIDAYIYTIYRVSLDDDVMSQTPLSERLLFQLDTLPGLVLAHQSIAHIFTQEGRSGALVISLEDYPNRP